MTPAEAYLTHWIIEGNTNPATNLLWGPRAQLFDPLATPSRRFKTGTTDDFKDVSGMGYIPGSLVTGVWMGNNNPEPMSNRLGQGLYSADGPLYLWHDFMEPPINQPWDWNGQAPVPNKDFVRPRGVPWHRLSLQRDVAPADAARRSRFPSWMGRFRRGDNVHHMPTSGTPAAASTWSSTSSRPAAQACG